MERGLRPDYMSVKLPLSVKYFSITLPHGWLRMSQFSDSVKCSSLFDCHSEYRSTSTKMCNNPRRILDVMYNSCAKYVNFALKTRGSPLSVIFACATCGWYIAFFRENGVKCEYCSIMSFECWNIICAWSSSADPYFRCYRATDLRVLSTMWFDEGLEHYHNNYPATVSRSLISLG